MNACRINSTQKYSVVMIILLSAMLVINKAAAYYVLSAAAMNDIVPRIVDSSPSIGGGLLSENVTYLI